MPSWRSLALVVFAAACAGRSEGPASTLDECELLTWETFGEGYLRSWCTGCHHSQLEPADREGAPVGLDFDDHDIVLDTLARIAARATGEVPTMPPVGGADARERARFERWLACEAP